MSSQPRTDAPLILVDGSSWLYRAFHALPPLTNSRGEPTGAIFGMGNMLRKLIREYGAERLAVVFDPRGPTFRNELYADYKANRPPVPPEMSAQFPAICELIEALGLPLLQINGFEADDVIGTLARRAEKTLMDTLIVTSDKDMAQLVSQRIHLLDTMRNRRTDPEGVREKFGVPPECIVDYLALVGDTSDNIPGVSKVGPKTAAKWLNQYGSLDAIVAHAADIKGKVGENLREALDQLPLARELATIRLDVDLGLDLDDLCRGREDRAAQRRLAERMEFNSWLRELNDAHDGQEPAPAAPDDVDYRTVTSESGFDALLEALHGAALICIDTETDSIDAMRAHLVGLSFAVEPGTAWYLPVAHDYDDAPAQLPRERALDRLRPLLEDENRPKVGQNAKYDINVLFRHGLRVNGMAHDTMLQSYVLNSTATRHDMDSLALKYLGHDTIKFADVAGKGAKQVTFNKVALEQAAPYAAEDADITLRLHRALWPQIDAEEPLRTLYRQIEIPLLPVLAAMERAGVLIDTGLLQSISEEMAATMQTLEARAHLVAEGVFNLNSPGQLQEILFERLGLPVQRRTPKGQPSTAEDVLRDLAALHELPEIVLEWRELAKLRSTYTDRLPEQVNPETGRVHTSYHQAVAATGRLSSSDPNLQNIPIRTATGRRIRQAFIAPQGCKLVAIDYSQIELRLMAHLSGDTGLTRAFNEGLDIHRATAAEVFGMALDAVADTQRRAAKAINFGLIYGMSAFGLARQLDIGRDQAAAYIERFFTRYPGVRSFMDRTRESAHSRGYVETLFGRRLYLPEINAKNAQRRQYAERTAINAPLQGTAADLIKQAMIEVHGWLSREHPDVRMIMQVHDELVFEMPTGKVEALAEPLARRMCAVARLDVPLVASMGVGDNWDEAHGKWKELASNS